MPAVIPLIVAGVSAAGSVAAAKMSSGAAKDAAATNAAATNHAADLGDAAAQRAEAFSRQQAEAGWKSTEAAQHASYDQWAARQRAIGNLGSSLGLNIAVPDYVPGVDPGYETNGTTVPSAASAPAAGGGDAAKLKALLDQGMDPQAAVAQFNTQYGRTKGNEAEYYTPDKHGGVATIGLPDAYLAKPGASWDITTRSGGAPAAPAAPRTLGGLVSPALAPLAPNTPMPTPFRPDTLAAYVRRS